MCKGDGTMVAEIVWCSCPSGCADVGEGGVYAIAIRRGGKGGSRSRFGGSLLAQFLPAGLVPCADRGVRFGGKGSGSDVSWKRLASVGICQIPVLDSVDDEWDMFFWGEQNLDGLPAHKAPEGQGGNGGRVKVPGGIVIAVGGLEGVAAAKDLPDVGDGFVWSVAEEFCEIRGAVG